MTIALEFYVGRVPVVAGANARSTRDVIGPVMRGPSSSHCAAALRIVRLARDLMGADLAKRIVRPRPFKTSAMRKGRNNKQADAAMTPTARSACPCRIVQYGIGDKKRSYEPHACSL
ncbi:MAG: hypothetical protein EXS36_14945 [Pedosphaera sp.]|nr:hypothetical protein [Pedosphaera sp.]